MDFLDIHSLNPYIRLATASQIVANTRIRQRIIFDYELIYMEQGTFLIRYAGKEYCCGPGSFLLIRPGIRHSLYNREQVSQPHIHFDMTYSPFSIRTPISFKDLPELTQEERRLIQADIFQAYPAVPLVHFSDKEQAKALFYGVLKQARSAPLTAKALLLQLLGMLITENFPGCFGEAEQTHTIAQQLKDYMDAGQGLSMELSAFEKQFSYSRYSLEKHFKKAYGMGVIAYRNQKRMELAKQLLRSDSVGAVADHLGFHSIYAFSRAFKNHYGYSPTQWKQQNALA